MNLSATSAAVLGELSGQKFFVVEFATLAICRGPVFARSCLDEPTMTKLTSRHVCRLSGPENSMGCRRAYSFGHWFRRRAALQMQHLNTKSAGPLLNPHPASTIEGSTSNPDFQKRSLMAVATGELIRAMNYVDDINATLRRILIYIPSMSADERKRLAEAMKGASAAITSALTDLEKAEK